LPITAAALATGGDWYVIHAGQELGPLSLAELVGMAALGEIAADDLVKKTGGLWTKARDFGFLQQQFVPKQCREEASAAPGASLFTNLGLQFLLKQSKEETPAPCETALSSDYGQQFLLKQSSEAPPQTDKV
jgi:hypothetical protein